MLSPDSSIHKLWWPVRVAFYLVCLLGAPLLYAIVFALHKSCRLVELGKKPSLGASPHIFACWHHSFVLYICGKFRFRDHAWLHHDGVYLGPGMLALHWLGVRRLIAVHPEHSRREAAEKLVGALKDGCSTFITPDGPFGPGCQAKPGVFHLSLQSGRPIVAARIHCNRYLPAPSWDRKQIPMPFSTITVQYSDPFQVTEQNFEIAKEWLEEQLGTDNA